jgi:hypothetical protein
MAIFGALALGCSRGLFFGYGFKRLAYEKYTLEFGKSDDDMIAGRLDEFHRVRFDKYWLET